VLRCDQQVVKQKRSSVWNGSLQHIQRSLNGRSARSIRQAIELEAERAQSRVAV